MKETTLLDIAKKHEKAKASGAFEVEDLLESVGWKHVIKPELEKQIADYHSMLVEASLSGNAVEVVDPVTGIASEVSPALVAARIQGLRYAIAVLEMKLREAAKAKTTIGG
jgi:hypothetical protein